MKKLNETLRRRPVMSAGRQIQNDNFIRYGKNTSLHLGSEIGHQQDSSSSLKLRGTKPGAKEWAWVVMSLLFEGLSATFEQLGYTLTGMVMAYVALLFFVVELILKAGKKEMLTWAVDSTSWLPLFRKRSAHNNSRNVMFLVSVVELFGLASAIWQCFQSTMQYMFNSHNPLKICLLPFLFVSCVIISKFIRCVVLIKGFGFESILLNLLNLKAQVTEYCLQMCLHSIVTEKEDREAKNEEIGLQDRKTKLRRLKGREIESK